MRHLLRVFPLLLAVAALLGSLLTGCEPREDIVTTDPGATLTPSVQTVTFDTVFTSLGSITKRFWVFNRNARAVRVDEISLVGAASAAARFELIIDGRPGTARRDFELRGKDSVLVLAKVTINPTAADTAFLVTDSVRIRANGTTSYVRLRAYGEDAIYYDAPPRFAALVRKDEHWTSRRPIVLLANTLVDSSNTLTIEPGTRVYVGPGASLVVQGRLVCGDLAGEAVKFRGLRRDDFYDLTDPRYPSELYDKFPKYANTPGQWGAIILIADDGARRTEENLILNTDIRNASFGVYVSNPDRLPGHNVRVEGCFIRNAYLAGVYGEMAGVPSGGVQLINTVITRCGERAVAGFGGGSWRLAHCTVEMGPALFPRRDTEALLFTNDLEVEQDVFVSNKTTLTVENSIVWSNLRSLDDGQLIDEILLLRKGANPDSSYTFHHNLLQTRAVRYNDGAVYNRPNGGASSTNLLNQDPQFRNPTPIATKPIDLRVDSIPDLPLLPSPARRLGVPLNPSVPRDLRNELRDASQPSAGAYEAAR